MTNTIVGTQMDPGDGAVALAWVIVDEATNDDYHHVSDFAGQTPRERPQCFCPVCTREVVLKLGEVRAHHAAHHPGAICPVTNPLVALHLNTKMHLRRALADATSLRILRPCTSNACAFGTVVDWAGGWTSLRVETTVGSLAPDITLLRGEEAIAAIDVTVTGILDRDKIKEREREQERIRAAIPWVAIRAAPDNYLELCAWTTDKPLEVEPRGPLGAVECPTCQTARLDREYREKNGEKPRQFRIVDFYYPDGSRRREVYRTFAMLKDGAVISMRLESNGETIATIDGPGNRDTMEELKAAFKRRNQTIRGAAQIGYCTSWEQWNEATTFLHMLNNPLDYHGTHIWKRRRQTWIPRRR